MKFIINGFKDDNKIFWKRHIPCICNGIHDLKSCKHCKHQHRESLVPRESFTVQEPVHDKNMKIIKYEIIYENIKNIWKDENMEN